MGSMEKRRAAIIYAISVSVIWGLSFLSSKVALAALPPMTLAAARFAVAVLLLVPIAAAAKESLSLRARDLPRMALTGLMGVTVYFLCENNGIALLTASESSLVVATIPVITMLADRLVCGTALAARSYVGAALSFAGVALIVLPSLGRGSSSAAGFLFMGGAAAAWVLYALWTRPLSSKYGRVAVTFWQSLFGLLGCLPFALAEFPAWKAPSLPVVLNVLYLGVFCSAAGYWLYIAAMDGLGAGGTSVFLNLVPVVSVCAAFFFLGERLGLASLAGGAVAVAGVYLATLPGRAGPSETRAGGRGDRGATETPSSSASLRSSLMRFFRLYR
jgi:drug/metabolite transporter (DMT)-like permease